MKVQQTKLLHPEFITCVDIFRLTIVIWIFMLTIFDAIHGGTASVETVFLFCSISI